jgi:predicted metal-dependent phosphoesterase TrpH
MRRIIISAAALLVSLSASAQFYYQDAANEDMLRHARQTSGERKEVMVPKEINGYNVYKVDLHMHTMFSDGAVTPEFRVREAWMDGLDAIAITEHVEARSYEQKMLDFLKGYVGEGTKAINSRVVDKPADERGFQADLDLPVKLAQDAAEAYGILVIPGAEISRPPSTHGHYNALFTTDNDDIYDPDPETSFRKARAQGAVIMQNHPGWRRSEITYLDFERDVYSKGLIDGVEVMNGAGVHIESMTRAAEYNLFVTSTTDAHDTNLERYRMNGAVRNMTLVLADDCSLESLKEALLSHRCIAYSFETFAGERSLLVDFFKASVKCEVINVDAKGRKTVKMTNMTSFPFLLDFGGNPVIFSPFTSVLRTVGPDGYMKMKVINMWQARDVNPDVEYKF